METKQQLAFSKNKVDPRRIQNTLQSKVTPTFHNYRLVNTLGQTNSEESHSALTDQGNLILMKKLLNSKSSNSESYTHLENLSKSQHENIIEIKDVFQVNNDPKEDYCYSTEIEW